MLGIMASIYLMVYPIIIARAMFPGQWTVIMTYLEGLLWLSFIPVVIAAVDGTSFSGLIGGISMSNIFSLESALMTMAKCAVVMAAPGIAGFALFGQRPSNLGLSGVTGAVAGGMAMVAGLVAGKVAGLVAGKVAGAAMAGSKGAAGAGAQGASSVNQRAAQSAGASHAQRVSRGQSGGYAAQGADGVFGVDKAKSHDLAKKNTAAAQNVAAAAASTEGLTGTAEINQSVVAGSVSGTTGDAGMNEVVSGAKGTYTDTATGQTISGVTATQNTGGAWEMSKEKATPEEEAILSAQRAGNGSGTFETAPMSVKISNAGPNEKSPGNSDMMFQYQQFGHDVGVPVRHQGESINHQLNRFIAKS
jgi:hypothetical protein